MSSEPDRPDLAELVEQLRGDARTVAASYDAPLKTTLSWRAADAIASLQTRVTTPDLIARREAVERAIHRTLPNLDAQAVIRLADAIFALEASDADTVRVSREVTFVSPSGPYQISDAAREKIAQLKRKPSDSGQVRFGLGQDAAGAWVETDAGITVSQHMLARAIEGGSPHADMLRAFAEILPRYAAMLTAAHPKPEPMETEPSAADMAAFGASEAAGYLYPGESQQTERNAFCAGAAHAMTQPEASRSPVSEERARAILAEEVEKPAGSYAGTAIDIRRAVDRGVSSTTAIRAMLRFATDTHPVAGGGE